MHDAALQLDYDVLILTFYLWRGVSRSPEEIVMRSFTIGGLWIDGKKGGKIGLLSEESLRLLNTNTTQPIGNHLNFYNTTLHPTLPHHHYYDDYLLHVRPPHHTNIIYLLRDLH